MAEGMNMEGDKLITKEEVMLVLRRLELKGLIISFLASDGQVRWRVTEKGKLMKPDEMDIDIPRIS
jgi:hypothetical protein